MQSTPVALPGPTVLVVDDEPAVCEYTARVLAGDGYQVITAGDGIGALQALESYPSTVQLVGTDVAMPNMSGTELAAELPKIGQRLTAGSGWSRESHHSRACSRLHSSPS